MEMAAAVAIVCVCVCASVHVCVRFSVRVYGICCVNGFLGLPRAQNETVMKSEREREGKRGLGLLTEIFQFTCIRTTVINNKALEKGQRKALKMNTK